MTGEDLIVEVTAGMEVVALPADSSIGMNLESVDLNRRSSGVSCTASESKTLKQGPMTLLEVDRRPFDVVREAGPAADPIAFAHPLIDRGRRDDVLCYNESTMSHSMAQNALFRDFSGDDQGLSQVQRAYWKVPFKEPIKTIMGHVNICVILERCMADQDDSSVEHDDECSEDEEIVFKLTNQYAAVKVNYYDRMEKLRNRHAEDPLKEIAAMQIIGNDHPNVMGCMEVLFDGKNLNVVMPYAGSGDLFQLLQDSQSLNSHTPGLTEPQARFWFRQVMLGLKHLHSVGICHRDLSPENVMIDGSGCLIIDMGMALRIPFTDPANPVEVVDITKGTRRRMIRPQGTCGKLPYMSPEVYRNRDDFDGDAVDVWTAGTILFCMVTGNRSYQRPTSSDPQYYWMTNGLHMLMEDWGVSLSDEGMDLLQGMLNVDPRLRLSTDEVLIHPWFHHPDEPMRAPGQPMVV